MICSLCLKEVLIGEETIVVDEKIRHESCSIELDKMVDELEKIYENSHKDFVDGDI